MQTVCKFAVTWKVTSNTLPLCREARAARSGPPQPTPLRRGSCAGSGGGRRPPHSTGRKRHPRVHLLAGRKAPVFKQAAKEAGGKKTAKSSCF